MMNFKNILLLLLVLIASICLKAQSDSILIETEIVSDQESYYIKKYQYLDINLADEGKLLKVGIQPFKPSDLYTEIVITINLGYENKMNESLSLINEINLVFNLPYSYKSDFSHYGYSFGTRYYPLKSSQVDKQISGDNCNGFYLYGGLADILMVITYRVIEDDIRRGGSAGINLKPRIAIGFQQKITRHLYFDTNISGSYNFYSSVIGEGDFGFGVTFLFGGLLSFSN